MKKSIKHLVKKLTEDNKNSFAGGYRAIRGGRLSDNGGNCNNGGCTGTNSGTCTNSSTCSSTNTTNCNNSGDCKQTTNQYVGCGGA